LSQAQKKPKLQDSLTKTRTKASLIPNPNYETRKTKKMTQVPKKNPTRFYCKEKMKTKQGYDKKKYPKLVLNRLKVMGNPTSIYTHLAPSSRKFLKKLPIYMWPMFAHVHTCTLMCELKLN
jgi:hypothetical protein